MNILKTQSNFNNKFKGGMKEFISTSNAKQALKEESSEKVRTMSNYQSLKWNKNRNK